MVTVRPCHCQYKISLSITIQFPSPTIHRHLKHCVISLKQIERSRQLFQDSPKGNNSDLHIKSPFNIKIKHISQCERLHASGGSGSGSEVVVLSCSLTPLVPRNHNLS